MSNALVRPQEFETTHQGGRFNTRTIMPPLPELVVLGLKSLGIERHVAISEGGAIKLTATDLTLDTPLDTPSHGEISVREAIALPEIRAGGKLRCQTPFRDSGSVAAFLSLGGNGKPFIYDSGENTTHWLSDASWAIQLPLSAPGASNDIEYANLSDLDTNPPPPRHWLVPDWFPLGTVVALFSLGGLGKTLFAQQLATHITSGTELFGQKVISGATLGYLCEDDNDELRRRQIQINGALDLNTSPLKLYLEGRAGKPNTLISVDSNRQLVCTNLFHHIDEECAKKRPRLLILDNIAQMYGGQENDRHEVTMFCNALTGLAVKHHCCVLLLGHTAKATESQFSGSTAWEAAVRTRLWLNRTDNGLLELHRKKANYSSLDSIQLEWQAGYLHPITGRAGYNSRAMESAKAAVLNALAGYLQAQIPCSNSPQARNYLPKLMEKEGKLGGISLNSAKSALENLILCKQILPNKELGWKTPSRHQACGLALANNNGAGNSL